MRGQGYRSVYAPKAIVYNRGPETVGEFVKQRKRIYFGHLAVKNEYSYEVSTMKALKLVGLLGQCYCLIKENLLYAGLTILLEMYSRYLATVDYYQKTKKYTIWEVIKGSKKRIELDTVDL